MTQERFHVFTIFKYDCNDCLFDVTQLIMTTDIYAYILCLLETMFFFLNSTKNIGTLRNLLVRKPSANGQFPQILRRFSQKCVETIRRRKISTLGNQTKC